MRGGPDFLSVCFLLGCVSESYKCLQIMDTVGVQKVDALQTSCLTDDYWRCLNVIFWKLASISHLDQSDLVPKLRAKKLKLFLWYIILEFSGSPKTYILAKRIQVNRPPRDYYPGFHWVAETNFSNSLLAHRLLVLTIMESELTNRSKV